MADNPRNAARWKIIQVVNKEVLRRPRTGRRPIYGMKHIQWVVCIGRRRGLVDDATLIAAGYNPRSVTRG